MSKPKTTPCKRCGGKGEIPSFAGLRERRIAAGLKLWHVAEATGYRNTHIRQVELLKADAIEPFASRYIKLLTDTEKTKTNKR